MRFNSVHKLVMTEFYGTGNYYLWSESYHIFKTAAICFEILEPENIDFYDRLIRKFSVKCRKPGRSSTRLMCALAVSTSNTRSMS